MEFSNSDDRLTTLKHGFTFFTNKQTNKQTNEHPNKQINKQSTAKTREKSL